MTLSLMCKPMLVTLPFLLLVLDAWPLRRTEGWGRLILEKAPLMVIAAAFSVVAVQAQSHAGAMIDTITIRPIDRVGNALESYARYLGSMAWPMDLSPIYNYPRPGLLRVLPHALGLATFTAAAWMLRRRRPAVWTGWLWYLGLLVPVIGLVQVGLQPRADRYTYLPMIGVLLAAVWLIAERWRPLALGAAAILACFWFTLSWQQSAVWNHTLSLYRHAIALAPGNPRALSGYAVAMVKDGRLQEARGWLLQAVHANPHDAQVRTNLGMVSAKLGLFDEAIEHLNMSLSIHEPAVEPHVNLGNALLFKGRIEQAMTHYRRALELRPDHANAWNNLGYALSRQGDWSGATEHYRKAASLMPDYAEPHVNLAEALHRMGNTQDAAAHLAIARRLDPDHPELDKVQRMLHAPPSPRAIIP
jgi:Flp pilus assembly protein TadD